MYNEITIMNKEGEHLDIKHMKYFMEVVNQGGMTNASKSLYIQAARRLVKQLKI